MNKSQCLTDKEVELEIARLRESEDVRLGRIEQRIRYKRRQYMYQLRLFEKAGKELREAGITEEMLRNEEIEYTEDEL